MLAVLCRKNIIPRPTDHFHTTKPGWEAKYEDSKGLAPKLSLLAYPFPSPLTHLSRRGNEVWKDMCYLNVQFSLFLELSLQVRHVIVLEEFDLAP